jgi:DNA-binding beta-propeller fold protein YncE
MTGLHPHHISVSPDGARALITATSADLSLGHGAGAHAGHGGGAVSTVVYQLDIASRELREVITLDATAHNAAFTKDGATVVLAMMEHGMIAGYDATTFTETFTAMGFMMPLEVTPTGTGTLLVAESGASRVSVFDLGSRTISNQFEVGAVPVAAWASGGSAYFVSVEEGMQVRHLVEGDAGVTLDEHIVDPEGMPGQAVLTPNGDELWVAVEDRGVLALFGATTHEKLAEIAAGMKPHGIVFEPSGERAFVTDEDGGKLLIIDVAARSISSELPLGGKPNGIVWLERQ